MPTRTESNTGRRSVLITKEEEIVAEGIMFAAHGGFAIDNSCLKYMMPQISADGRPWWTGNATAKSVFGLRRKWVRLSLRGKTTVM